MDISHMVRTVENYILEQKGKKVNIQVHPFELDQLKYAYDVAIGIIQFPNTTPHEQGEVR